MKTQISSNSLPPLPQLDSLPEQSTRSPEWTPGPAEWERSHFSMSVEELEVHEAIVAMSRLLDGDHVGTIARRALRYAINALQVNGGVEG